MAMFTPAGELGPRPSSANPSPERKDRPGARPKYPAVSTAAQSKHSKGGNISNSSSDIVDTKRSNQVDRKRGEDAAAKPVQNDPKPSDTRVDRQSQLQPSSQPEPRDHLPHITVRTTTDSPSVRRVELTRSNTTTAHPVHHHHPSTDHYAPPLAPDNRYKEEEHDRRSVDRFGDRRPLRPLDDDHGRRYTYEKPESNVPPFLSNERIIYTIYNRIEHFSVDVHEGHDEYQAPQHFYRYYKGAPGAGPRHIDDQLAPPSEFFPGWYPLPYARMLGAHSAGAAPKRSRDPSPERVGQSAPAEQQYKRQRSHYDSARTAAAPGPRFDQPYEPPRVPGANDFPSRVFQPGRAIPTRDSKFDHRSRYPANTRW